MNTELKDETLKCKDCGENFTFTVKDQEFYKKMNFNNKPVRCKACRDLKKNNSQKDSRY